MGAIIRLIRSGDVIPHIESVVQCAKTSLFPKVPYLWNDTNVDIYVDTNKITKNNHVGNFDFFIFSCFFFMS